MVRGVLTLFVFSLFLAHEAASLELLANYKYWKSVSDQLSYDYSGNLRHAGLFWRYIVTDRGVLANEHFYPSFMAYRYPYLSEYVFSFWMFNNPGTGYWRYVLYHSSHSVLLLVSLRRSSVNLEFYMNNSLVPSKTANIPMFIGWNLHTTRVYMNSASPTRLKIEHYLNLASIHSTFLDTADTNIILKYLHLGVADNGYDTQPILYELWIHTGFSNISELISLLSSSSSCGCTYNCATSPTTVCLPIHTKNKNKLGDLCPNNCTGNNLSCDTKSNCIPKSKSECKYGLYDLETYECLFYCPKSSCSCPSSFVNGFYTITTFSCSCTVGYKSISYDPPACISIHCLIYHKAGYKYVCDTTESGYFLDSLGECCICSTGFTQVSNNPLICISSSICLSHAISGGDYTCSSCALGYLKDLEGKCNKCDSNYVNVLSNPFTCILEIERCSNYTYDGTKWVCQICNEGYQLNTNQECNDCESGYVLVNLDPLICTIKVSNCDRYSSFGAVWECNTCIKGYILSPYHECDDCEPGYVAVDLDPLVCTIKVENCGKYSYDGIVWKCDTCNQGYILNLDKECNDCEPGYVVVNLYPLICTIKIENCAKYSYDGIIWKCDTCNQGYILNLDKECNDCEPGYEVIHEKPIVCAIKVENCDRYISDGTNLKCDACNKGYTLSLDRKCNGCGFGYIEILREPLVCVLDINHCASYEKMEEDWMCKECEGGYKLSSSRLCDKCQPGYLKIDSEEMICKKEIENCIEYNLYSEEFECLFCEAGYEIGPAYKCSLCETGYISTTLDPLVCVEKIPHCDRYEFINDNWECTACESGYVLLSDCKPEIPFCINHKLNQDSYFCDKCDEGFTLDMTKSCICGKGYYITDDKKCKECLYHCIKCQMGNDGDILCLLCESGFDLIEDNCEETKTVPSQTLLELSSQITQGTIVASVSVSMVSLNLNSVLSMIGTIQILNYILLYNLNIPDRVRAILEGISLFRIFPNIFEYFIPNQDTLDIERYNRVDINNELFLINSGKTLSILIIMLLVIMIIKLLISIKFKAKQILIIKKVSSKLLGVFEWNFVIGYLIQASLELTITSLINIYHASFSNIHSIIGFIISIITLVKNILDLSTVIHYISILIYSKKL